MRGNFLFVHFTTQLKNLILSVDLVTFCLKEFYNIQMPSQPLFPNESDLESPPSEIFALQVLQFTMLPPFQQGKFPFCI